MTEAAAVTEAPFGLDQVKAINRFQADSGMHPFTCVNDQHRSPLLGTERGMMCLAPGCDYLQTWVNSFMADPHAVEGIIERSQAWRRRSPAQ